MKPVLPNADRPAPPLMNERERVVATDVPWPDWSRHSFAGLGGGTAQSIARAISADATTIVGSVGGAALADPEEPVRWRAGKLEPLDAATHAIAFAVSANGDVIGGDLFDGKNAYIAPVIWRSGAVVPLDRAGLDGWRVEAVSGDGATVLGVGTIKCDDSWCSRVVRWDATRKSELVQGDKGPLDLHNAAMSADGKVLAGMFVEEDRGSARVVGNRVDKLGPGARALGISHDGKVIVGSNDDRASAWRGTTKIDLGLLPGFLACEANAASNDGSRIVGVCVSHRAKTAFMWDAQRGIRAISDVLAKAKVDITGWDLTEANSICARGVSIVGHGKHSDKVEAWIAIVPR